MPGRVVTEIIVDPVHGELELGLRRTGGFLGGNLSVVPTVEVPLIHAQELVTQTKFLFPRRGTTHNL